MHMFQTISVRLAAHLKREREHSHFVRIEPPLKEIPLSAVTTADTIPFFGGRRMFPFPFPTSTLVMADHTDQPWRWPCTIRLWNFKYTFWVLRIECACHRPHSLQCRAHTVAITSLWRRLLIENTPRKQSPLEPVISLISPKCRIPHCHWCRSTHLLLLLDEFILWTGASLRMQAPDALVICPPSASASHWVLFCLSPYRFPSPDYPFAVRLL
ncbi:E4 control protein [Psittacine aviadenovirus B]|uniref:E4 control protein n=1 Tax=psittacine adenovirus 4 TaxID=2773287 RepID=A0A1P8SW64_9ADEN|nr:E4 control protein [Psittacine aviadenovirus B]APY28342.1 E4 control protein [psittacine adenovirus 4]